MEDLEAKPLSQEHLDRLHRTISTNALWQITMHKMLTGQGMSVVRTGDMEPLFFMRLHNLPSGPIPNDNDYFSQRNLLHLGLQGIPRDEMLKRITLMLKADYLGVNVSGYLLPEFDVSPWVSHPQLVDNYFSNEWTKPMIDQMLRRARGVMMINREESHFEKLKRKVSGSCAFIKMDDWRDADRACKEACDLPHQLVILSGGTAGKYIAIEMAAKGKVVLDVGQSAWCFVR